MRAEYVSAYLMHLSNDAVLAGRWAGRRSVLLVATVRRLGALEFDAVLLAVVALVRTVAIVAVVVILRSGVWRSGCAVVVVVVIGLRIVVVVGSSGPASTIERRATSLAPATSGDTAIYY